MRRVFMYSLAVPAALLAQYQGQEPMRTSVAELTRSSMMYNERPVIVVGELSFGDAEDTNYEIYELRGEDALRTVRVATPRGQMEDLRFNMGQKVELQGIFFDLQNVMDPQRHPILRYFPGAVRTDGLGFDKNYFIAVTSVDVIEAVESDLKPEKAEEEADPAEPDID
ncbi:MAG: hypothetical protein ACRD21_21095, partial [Vicinamibacteria bacterium]